MRIENIKTKKYPIFYSHQDTRLKSIIACPDIDYDADTDEYVILAIYVNDDKISEINLDPEVDGESSLKEYKSFHLTNGPINILEEDVVYLSVIKNSKENINLTIFTEV